jgi:predicted transcriptional regulator
MSFDTLDFVKVLDNKFYYSADFELGVPVDGVSGTFKLPNGFLLVGENIDSSILSNPENATAHLAGGRILIIWDLEHMSEDDDLKFEILYEQVKTPPWFNLRMRHFVLFGGAFAVVLGFIFVVYLRRSQTLVLSVLDEYEKQIMSIVTREGEIKQRRIVQMTNLSKAKVSRVVKTLSERGLIEVERVGRTNKIKLVKKRLEI